MGTALVGAGVYAADARAQALPLVSPFGPVDSSSHDWTVMLLRFGRISRDQEIGATLMNAGLLTMALSLALAVWVLWLMAESGAAAPGKAGRALYDAGEEERLGTFLSGGTVERVPPRRFFKRPQGGERGAGEKEPGAAAPGPRAPLAAAPGGARPAAPRTTTPGKAQPPAPGTAKARPGGETEEERFRRFLERDRGDRRP